MLELVENHDEVKKNTKIFNEELSQDELLVQKLSTFQHWYYIDELDLFAPSKFIGYKDNTAITYRVGTSVDKGYMDGRETEPKLKKWFRKANEEEYEELIPKLIEMIEKFDKKPNKRTCIHVIK